jgi:tRNA A-37 threonylcarbamoyl transferase component Bud32
VSRPTQGHAFAGAPRWFPVGSAPFEGEPTPTGRRIKDDPDTIIWAEELHSGRRAIVKMYRHRSGFASLRGRLSHFRVQREYEVLARLSAAGVPTSEPIAWAHGRTHEHGRYELLATLEIRAATSVMELARADSAAAANFDLAPLFRSVRRMHEGGVFHGSLKLHNILAARGTGDELTFHVIDTPRALLYPRSIVGTPMARFDLLRLVADVSSRLGRSGPEIPLQAYGLDEAGRRALLARLPGFGSRKLARATIRARALASQVGARLFVRAGPRASSSLPA